MEQWFFKKCCINPHPSTEHMHTQTYTCEEYACIARAVGSYAGAAGGTLLEGTSSVMDVEGGNSLFPSPTSTVYPAGPRIRTGDLLVPDLLL